MRETPDSEQHSATLLEWLDAAARGETPLPWNRTIATAQAFLQAASHILAWAFTVVMLKALVSGSSVTSFCLAYEAFLAGWICWQVTMVVVTASGTLAFAAAGRFVEATMFLVASPLVNFGYLAAESGLATVDPLLVIPLHLALNGAYLSVVWLFLVRGKRVMDLLGQRAAEG